MEVELQKPSDGSDIKTPRGVTAQDEVVRLRKLLADLAVEGELLQRTEHQKRIRNSKNKQRIKRDTQINVASPAVNKQLRKNFINNVKVAQENDKGRSPLARKNSIHIDYAHHHHEEEVPELTSEEDKKNFEKLQSWIRVSYADMNVAVLVSDLSGFTSTTRKYGIVHFASVIVRMRQLCLPILKRRGAIYITTEADNFIVIFPDTHQAACAALEMQQVIREYKESLTPERDHYKIKLNGIGVYCGEGVVVDKQGKLHGRVANFAYHIGEDLCTKTSVLFSNDVKKVIEKNPNFAKTQFKRIETTAEDGEVYEVSGETASLTTELVSTDDLTYLHESLSELVSRHNPDIDVEKVDEDIKGKYMNVYSVLMFEFDFEHIEEEAGAEAGLRLKFLALDLIRPVLLEYGGNELEDVLWIFEDSKKAVAATMKLKDAIAAYNSEKKKCDQIVISGYGIHTGEMIFIEGTDIHWGDPVNTSSKLGQDLAKNGDFLVTSKVHDRIKEDPSAAGEYSFEPKTLRRSGVDFLCYSVKKSLPAVKEAPTEVPVSNEAPVETEAESQEKE